MPLMGRVLITGGTGTLGQELTRHLLKETLESICIYSRNEYAQVIMKSEFKDDKLRFFIGDVRDRDRLYRAMSKVDYVIHCAALKHVDVCEYNPIEAVRTNVLGATNVIDAAIDAGVKKVVNISSDKAVHPINIYGSTKLAAEKLFLNSNVYGNGKTVFSCVRFGNFTNSRGSVTEIWKKQRIKGEPITLTDKEMVRFWIDVDKAADFVIKTLERMEGGEIFIPLMPEKTMVELLKEIAPEAKVKVIGRREGEKKQEELVAEGEKFTREEDCLKIICWEK